MSDCPCPDLFKNVAYCDDCPYGTQSGTSILAEEKTPKKTGSKPESDPN